MKFNLTKALCLALFLTTLFFACKKDDFDVNDPKVYTWQRMLYRQAFQSPTEIPSVNRTDYDRVLISTDEVRLTGLQVKKQKDSIWINSGKILSYEYKKLK